jgi:pectate lyase
MAIFRVSNQSQLNSAIQSARGGDSILLASGNYSQMKLDTASYLTKNTNFSSKVTIASADPNRPAVVNELMMRGAANVEIKNVRFDYDGRSQKPFWLENTRNVTIDNASFEGNGPTGLGIRIKSGQAVTIKNSDFLNFNNGMDATNVRGLTLVDNTIRGMANDGFTFAGLDGALIQGNDFRAFKSPTPASLHKDSIQFRLTLSDVASKNVTIRDNVIDSSDVRHGIFFFNEKAKAGQTGVRFENILIEDNYIRSAHVHGITMDHGTRITIRDNTLIQNPDMGFKAAVHVPLINVSNSSLYVAIQGNRVASIPDWNPTWTISGNVTGSRDMMHWEGSGATLWASASSSLSAASLSAATADALADTSDNDAGASPARAASVDRVGDQTFRLDGRGVDGQKMATVSGVDFDLDDVIVFNHFDAGTFEAKRGGNGVDVWNSGAAVKIDSVLDLRELVAHSDHLSASVSGDDLILRIAQDDGDVAVVRLDGLGDDYAAANHPELF